MRARGAHRRLLGGALILIFGAALACNSEPDSLPTVTNTMLAENPGVEAQTATVGTTLATPISVTLTQGSQPLAGVPITWKVESGGGSVDAATSTTDANGNAVVHWTLGTVAGPDTLIGTTSDGATSIITATAVAGPVASITEVSGDAQSVSAGTASAPLVVKAVDQYGNPVAGATVIWSASGGVTLNNSTTTTDSGGLAQAVLTMSGAPGTYVVSASVAGVAPVSFNETED